MSSILEKREKINAIDKTGLLSKEKYQLNQINKQKQQK